VFGYLGPILTHRGPPSILQLGTLA
jgi:hypothetical protein